MRPDNKMTISFLASHGGSSARHIIKAIESGQTYAQIGCVITNNKGSTIYEWCEEKGIPVIHISRKTHPDQRLEDLSISETLMSYKTELVILSGYMKMIGEETLSFYKDRILNMHPSLLPKYGGKGMYGDRVHTAVLNSGDKISGATVHFVNECYDEGEVFKQTSVPLSAGETVQSLREKIQNLEGKLYLEVIKEITHNKSLLPTLHSQARLAGRA